MMCQKTVKIYFHSVLDLVYSEWKKYTLHNNNNASNNPLKILEIGSYTGTSLIAMFEYLMQYSQNNDLIIRACGD